MFNCRDDVRTPPFWTEKAAAPPTMRVARPSDIFIVIQINTMSRPEEQEEASKEMAASTTTVDSDSK
jgi:hypothetical protein